MEQIKIDRRKSYYIVLDIEGTNTVQDALCYDLGAAVIDKQGNVYETLDLVIYDIYALEKDLMKSAYYANKLPQYEEELKSGVRTMVSIFTAKKELKRLCDKYQVKAIMAHNARYDYFGLNTTLKYITKSKQRYFFPYFPNKEN